MKKILIVDDDAINLKMAEYILQKNANYEVHTARSGQETLELLQRESYDLILLDIDMPEMNGIQTLEQIRQNPDWADLKVIFLSASALRKDMANAIRLGALDFVKKPFFPEELMERVSIALQVEGRDEILVVDDDKMCLMFAKKMLGTKYQVDTASSADEALEYLREKTPDLILLDFHMPEINGLEALQKIKAIRGKESIPVVFLTADSSQETEIEIFKAGAMDFITKPFVADVVIQRINRILELRHLQCSLQTEVEKKTKELKESHIKVRNLSTQIMLSLTSAIDAKDTYTKGHSSRVAKYSREIARRMGKKQGEMDEIYFAGLLHDVGKIGIPDAIINKPDKLTEEEFAVIQTHPSIGAGILGTISEMPTISVGAHYHHERYDGKGYPDGLVGEEIPELARIIGTADAYDAMSSKRSYRDILPQEVVRREIEKGKGLQFDPVIADIMLTIIDEDKEYNLREK